MQLFVVLTDHEGFEHKEVTLDLDEETNVFTLQERISSMWKVNVHQQIWFLEDGRQIHVTNADLQSLQIGLSHMEKLIVKHVEVERWSKYVAYVERMLKEHENKRANAELALEEYNQLRKKRHSVIVYWTDEEVESLCKATKQYFLRLHNEKRKNEDSEFICYFEKREEFEGYATNTLAFVQIHGERSITKYNVKCHHNSTKRSRCFQFPDITEFYCYKLLELIGVSPKCHIIPPVTFAGTKTDVYIATQWEDNFETLTNVIYTNNLCADLVVQLVVLDVLLFMDKLHEENCGRWKGREDAAAIVDFGATIDYKVYSDIESGLMTICPHMYWYTQYIDVRIQHDSNSWLTIAKKYVDKWDLVSKIELARQQFDPNNVLLESLEADYEHREVGWTATEQLEKFIETLYKNLGNLQDVLSYIV